MGCSLGAGLHARTDENDSPARVGILSEMLTCRLDREMAFSVVSTFSVLELAIEAKRRLYARSRIARYCLHEPTPAV